MKKKTTINTHTGLSGMLKASVILLMLIVWIGHEAIGQTTAQEAVAEYPQNNENVNLDNVRVSVAFDGRALEEAILQLGEISGVHFNYSTG